MKLYKRKSWLYYHYWLMEMSIAQIAKSIEVSGMTIYNWIKKYKIPTRSSGYGIHLSVANHCNLSQENIEWIDGELLGDGCLTSRSNYSAKFGYSSKYNEYINYISFTLNSFGIKQSGEIRKRYFRDWNNCCVYLHQSLDYVELLPIYKRWYPKGKKIVPKDIELTPLTCRQWHIGDGCLIHPKKGRPFVILSTVAFPADDVEWLSLQLNKLGLKTKRHPSNNIIYISPYSTKEFLDYIGECPVECYQYKWNY